MKAKHKKILASVITVVITGVILGLYFTMPFATAGVPQIVDRGKIPDGTEVILTQVSLGAFKPYEVSLFVHRPNGTWTQFEVEEQSISFRGQVLWEAKRKVMEIRHYGASFAYYDPAKEKVIFEDGRPARGPLTIVANPLAKTVLVGRRRPSADPLVQTVRVKAPAKPSTAPSDAGVPRDTHAAIDTAPSTDNGPAAATESQAPARPRHTQWSESECRIMEEDLDRQQKLATQCAADSDCCQVWDEVLGDCLPANRTADLQGYRDGIRALARNCGGAPRQCQGLEVACLFGQCELRPTVGETPGHAPAKKACACSQPYSPSIKTLRMGSPEVVLLTGPPRDVPAGDGAGASGKAPPPVFEVCVSAEGHVTSARGLNGDRSDADPWASLRATIERTWRFKPYLQDGKPHAFCTRVSFPLATEK